jgi:hypothetical protein
VLRASVFDEIKELRPVPVVYIVFEGGMGTITTVREALEQGVPVVVINGSGRACNVISAVFMDLELDAHWQTKQLGGGQGIASAEHASSYSYSRRFDGGSSASHREHVRRGSPRGGNADQADDLWQMQRVISARVSEYRESIGLPPPASPDRSKEQMVMNDLRSVVQHSRHLSMFGIESLFSMQKTLLRAVMEELMPIEPMGGSAHGHETNEAIRPRASSEGGRTSPDLSRDASPSSCFSTPPQHHESDSSDLQRTTPAEFAARIDCALELAIKWHCPVEAQEAIKEWSSAVGARDLLRGNGEGNNGMSGDRVLTPMAMQSVLSNMLQRALEWNAPAFFDIAIQYNASCESMDLLILWEHSGGGNFDDEFNASAEKRRR